MPAKTPIDNTVIRARKADVASLARAMEPVAKLCMKSGMGAGELLVAVKIACISVAAETAKLGKRLNHSRISAATGLTRKEVRALSDLVTTGSVSTGREVAKQRTARVLHGWRTDPEYLDGNGSPLPIEVHGPGLTFHELVRRYGGDVTPISVLNELINVGAVSRARDGRVAVRRTSPRVRGFGSDVVAEIAARLRDIGSTLVSNIEEPENPLFVGFREIKSLSIDEAALFQATFSERAASLVDGVERWRTGQARIRATTKGSGDGQTRVGLGVFLVNQQPTPAATARPRKRPTKS